MTVPRLTAQLLDSDVFIRIGNHNFKIPRDIFSSPGNSPNFFSLGFAVFLNDPTIDSPFPGVHTRALLRPPSIEPPTVNRDGRIFADILSLLRGYDIHIRDQEHHDALLRDCRYYHLRGLEQKLIPHHSSFNLQRGRSEIVIWLQDIRQSGVGVYSSPSSGDSFATYARPFVDDAANPADLIVQIRGESSWLELDPADPSGRSLNMRLRLHGIARARVASLLQVIAGKLGKPVDCLGVCVAPAQGKGQAQAPSTGLDCVPVFIDADADVSLDGQPIEIDSTGVVAPFSLPLPSSLSAAGESRLAGAGMAMGTGMGTTPITTGAPVTVYSSPDSFSRSSSSSVSLGAPNAKRRRLEFETDPSAATAPTVSYNPSPHPTAVPVSSSTPNYPVASFMPPPPSPIFSGPPSIPGTVPAAPVSTTPTPLRVSGPASSSSPGPSRAPGPGGFMSWVVRNAQWRVRIREGHPEQAHGHGYGQEQGLWMGTGMDMGMGVGMGIGMGMPQVEFVGVKISALSGQRVRNRERGFLGG